MKSQHPVDKWFRAMADKMPVKQEPSHWNALHAMLDETGKPGNESASAANNSLQPGGIAGSGGWFWISASVLLLIIVPATVWQWNLAGFHSEHTPSMPAYPVTFNDKSGEVEMSIVGEADHNREDSILLGAQHHDVNQLYSSAPQGQNRSDLSHPAHESVHWVLPDSLPVHSEISAITARVRDSVYTHQLPDSLVAPADSTQAFPEKRKHIFW